MNRADGGAPGTATVGRKHLTEFVVEALASSGASQEHAALTAEVLVAADLAGVDSHGVARLRRYVEGLRCGTINGGARPRVIAEHGGVSVVDADNGLGQPALCLAVDLGIERARDLGVAAVAVRRSNHIGIAGWYAERAARAGSFALVTTNATPQVAPAGAVTPVFGTDPVSYAVPTTGDPLCYDGATSVVPRGKLERLYREGRPMLPGWAVTPDGVSAHDIARVIAGLKAREGYALLPVGGLGQDHGGHKGSGIGLLAELLCGPLAGADWSPHTYGPQGANLGHFVLCLDLAALGDPARIIGDIEAMATEIRVAGRAEERVPVRLPGERRHRCARERSANGIPLARPVVEDLREIAELTGIKPLGLTFAPRTPEPATDRLEVIDLSSGQLVEPLPGPATETIRRMLLEPRVSAYAPGPGLPELRSAVAGHYELRTGTAVSPADVTVTAGARHGLFAAIMTIARGREVLVPAPHWSHYPTVVRQAGAVPVTVQTDPARGLLVDPARLEAARTARTAALLVNSPVNPSGACYDEDQMRSLRAWAADHHVCLIVDDIYWAYGGSVDTGVRIGPHEVVVGGASKVYALAGLRIGWVWADPGIGAMLRETVEHTTGPVAVLDQAAVAAVLKHENSTGGTGAAVAGEGVRRRAAALVRQRAWAVEAMAAVPYLRPLPPTGGIYLCLDASRALDLRLLGADNDEELCRALRSHAGVGLRAGSTFGMPGYLRLCVAETQEVLRSAARRLTSCLTAAATTATYH
jgi:LDH2 family malate/lactate/ureidoglycolate dehydrogenase/aspartate/methionine/tyrosine aminotransferase